MNEAGIDARSHIEFVSTVMPKGNKTFLHLQRNSRKSDRGHQAVKNASSTQC